MSVGYARRALSIVAFAILIVGFGVVAWDANNRQTQQTGNQARAPARHTSADVVAPKPDERIADYTWWLSVFTLALVVVSTFQIGFLIRADNTARLTAEAATGSADAARNTIGKMDASIATAIAANQIAVTNSHQQLRAYVTVQEISMTTHRHPDRWGTSNNLVPGNIHTYRFSVILKNGGMTPALNAKINISHQRFNNEIPADFSFPDSTLFGIALIGPQTIWFSPAVTVPATEIETPLVGAFHYLYGWIEYGDIFSGSPRHRTEFCFRINCERLSTNEPWITFSPYSRFNAADEDCLRPFNPHENAYG